MTDDDWSYKISKKYWQNKEELTIKLPQNIKDVKTVAYLLRTFLENEKCPFKIIGEIELLYSDKSADANLTEHWGRAYIIIPVLKRGILKKPRYDKLEEKHFIKVRISLDKSNLGTWQEHCWDNGNCHRWYMEMEQIKAWKELLEKFGKTLPSLKSSSEIGNPSAR
jgi:hypothetical protein